MASVIEKASGVALVFKLASIKKPTVKIMLAEEQASKLPGEASDPTKNVMNDGRYVPPGDALTVRHNKRANVVLGDGHVMPVLPAYGLDKDNYQADLP